MSSKKKLGGYALLVKRIQDDTIKLYENGEKERALLTALARRKLRLIEKFTGLDGELLIQYQALLYYKSRIPDLLFSYSTDEAKQQETYKVINVINEAMTKVSQAIEAVKESDVYKEFFEMERERRAKGGKKKKKAETEQKTNSNAGNGQDKKEEKKTPSLENKSAEQEQPLTFEESLKEEGGKV